MGKANKNLPKPNSLHTCDVSSAVHIRFIRKKLDARQATALHVKTTIICGFLLAIRRLLPEAGIRREPSYCFLRVMWQSKRLHKWKGNIL